MAYGQSLHLELTICPCPSSDLQCRTRDNMSVDEQKSKGGWSTGVLGKYSPFMTGNTAAISAGYQDRESVLLFRGDFMPDAWLECPAVAGKTEGFAEMLAQWPMAEAERLHKVYVEVGAGGK